ncbi:MAG: TlpA family protein disulfide reductase [Planctomycetales bacterium]
MAIRCLRQPGAAWFFPHLIVCCRSANMFRQLKRPNHPSIGSLVLLIAACLVHGTVAAQDAPKAAVSFRDLLEQHQKAALQAATDYAAAHPDADDADQARVWALETASAAGLEALVVPLARQYSARRDLDPASRQIGQAALCLGLARGGQFDEAQAELAAYLQGARFQSPFKALDLASGVAAQARIAGKLGLSREVLERVASAYPLHPQINEIVEGRIARQELIGKPAPPVATTDLKGQPLELQSLAGQVVLVDFWATNCAPCLAEFPNLRQIYKEFHPQGFEIVGVSFDDSPETVEGFRARAQLPWPMVMNQSQQGAISERFRTRTIPALFLVDRQGHVAQVDVRGPDLRAVVQRLLAGEERK